MVCADWEDMKGISTNKYLIGLERYQVRLSYLDIFCLISVSLTNKTKYFISANKN